MKSLDNFLTLLFAILTATRLSVVGLSDCILLASLTYASRYILSAPLRVVTGRAGFFGAAKCLFPTDRISSRSFVLKSKTLIMRRLPQPLSAASRFSTITSRTFPNTFSKFSCTVWLYLSRWINPSSWFVALTNSRNSSCVVVPFSRTLRASAL